MRLRNFYEQPYDTLITALFLIAAIAYFTEAPPSSLIQKAPETTALIWHSLYGVGAVMMLIALAIDSLRLFLTAAIVKCTGMAIAAVVALIAWLPFAVVTTLIALVAVAARAHNQWSAAKLLRRPQ